MTDTDPDKLCPRCGVLKQFCMCKNIAPTTATQGTEWLSGDVPLRCEIVTDKPILRYVKE